MMKLRPWIKLPSNWIEDGGLRTFRWVRGEGADNLAALMALTVISHHADQDSGIAHLTYDQLCTMTLLSRAKLSAGLSVLSERRIIQPRPDGRSTYRVVDYDPKAGWAMFPAKGMYFNGYVSAFADFKLRSRAELDAMKLYFLFASRRDRKLNMAMISYDKITKYSGVRQHHIRRALSVLAVTGLVHVERLPSVHSEHGFANAYRLAHLNTRRHMGTTGRGLDEFDVERFERGLDLETA